MTLEELNDIQKRANEAVDLSTGMTRVALGDLLRIAALAADTLKAKARIIELGMSQEVQP